MKCSTEAPVKEYPRGLPYSPPQEVKSPSWRYWPHVAFVLMVIVVAEFWFLGIRGNQSQVAPPVSLNPGPKSQPAAIVPLSGAEKPIRQLLETLGAWSGSHVYQSYLNIGMLADAVAHQAYGEEQAYTILATLTGLLQMMEQQMDEVAKFVDPEDRQALGKIRQLNRLLQSQADALVLSWETGDRKMEDEYLQIRAESWEGIQEILGVE